MMKRFPFLLLMTLLVLVCASCSQKAGPEVAPTDISPDAYQYPSGPGHQ